jgi:hypothetical protein
MRNPVRVLVESPHYVLGRFHLLRRAYSMARRAAELGPVKPALQIGELYGEAQRPLASSREACVASTCDARTHVDNLARDSFSAGLQLTPAAVAELVKAATELPLRGRSGRFGGLRELTMSSAAKAREAIATVEDSSRLPAIEALAADPRIVDVVTAYLGYHPRRVSSWLFWSLKNGLSDAAREAQYQTIRFHYDVHGFNFLYVSFYLLDTDARSGAHVLIEGSHRDKRLRHLLGSAKLDDARALADYGAARIRTIEGSAGAGFFEDTSCYHKALPPLDRERLMLQLRYQ